MKLPSKFTSYSFRTTKSQTGRTYSRSSHLASTIIQDTLRCRRTSQASSSFCQAKITWMCTSLMASALCSVSPMIHSLKQYSITIRRYFSVLLVAFHSCSCSTWQIHLLSQFRLHQEAKRRRKKNLNQRKATCQEREYPPQHLHYQKKL